MAGEKGEGCEGKTSERELRSVLQLRWDLKPGVELGNCIHDFVK